ncbi:hypothetical protein [Mycobacterium sp. SMC-11]|uniref:hypothetical protein n=1 Tax=Mycobacterium sp. SMC-11 TaxID=3385969 RepID=UPI00390C7DF8
MMVPWSELEPGQAETLLAVLLYNEHRRAVRVRPSRGDYGIDVLNPNPEAPETFDVYQIKYFHGTLTAGQKGQVEKSFRRVLIGLVRRGIPLANWYLLAPVDNTIDAQLDWFNAMPGNVIAEMFDDARFIKLDKKQPPLTDDEKARITAWHNQPGRIIDWEGRSACVTLAAKYPFVVDYYMHGGREHLNQAFTELVSLIRGPEAAVPTPGELLAPADVRSHLDNLKNALDKDPHFLYAFSVDPTPPDLAVIAGLSQQGFDLDRAATEIVTAPDLVAATQQPLSDGWTLTFRIYQRFAEALNERPIPIRLTFASAEATFDRHAFDMWRKYGTPLTAQAHVDADLPGGLGTQGLAEVSMQSPGVNYDVRFRIRTPAGAFGEELSFAITVTRGPDGTGTREYGTDATGFLTVELLSDTENQTGTWHFTREDIVGAEVVSALPSIEFLQDLTAPNTLQVAERLGPFVDYRDIPDERHPKFHDDVMDYLRALVIIQQHTPTPIRIPDLTTLTRRDINAVFEASALVNGQAVITAWDSIGTVVGRPADDAGPEQEIDFTSEYQLLVMLKLIVEVGDQKLILGTVAQYALSARYGVEGDGIVARPYRNDTLQKTFSPLPDAAGALEGHVLGRRVGSLDVPQIKLDEPDTWPPELRSAAQEAARHPDCQTTFTADLRPPDDLSNRIMSVLSERGIIVYQCTRLLDSEIDDIRTHGLRAASEELLADKLERAQGEGLLTAEQVQLIQTTGALMDGGHRAARTNEIWALTVLQTLSVFEDGVEPLFGHWGGEITYFWQTCGSRAPALAATLQSLGTPALIEFVLKPAENQHYSPELANIVIARWRNLDDCAGEVHFSVPPGARVPVLDVWLPDDPRWPTMTVGKADAL